MTVSLIAAMDQQWAIGKDNAMAWHLPAEFAHFKQTTIGKTVLMGRKTFQSIGKPLPNRRNVILTRLDHAEYEGCEIVHSVEEALTKYGQEDELMIAGGAEVYKQFLPFADTIYLTKVDVKITNPDAYFPAFDESVFDLVDIKKVQKDEKNSYDFTIYTYKRK